MTVTTAMLREAAKDAEAGADGQSIYNAWQTALTEIHGKNPYHNMSTNEVMGMDILDFVPESWQVLAHKRRLDGVMTWDITVSRTSNENELATTQNSVCGRSTERENAIMAALIYAAIQQREKA